MANGKPRMGAFSFAFLLLLKNPSSLPSSERGTVLMASPTVVPAAPAAAPAPVAAPAPTPAAPVAAPAASATETSSPVSSPALTETSPGAPPAATSDAANAPPVAVAGAPSEPKAGDFDDPGAFLTAHSRYERELEKWNEEHPEGSVSPQADKTPEEAAAKPEEKTPEEQTPAELADDTPLLTPQEFDKLINDDASLKAAYEANPKAKGQVMKMARELADAKPKADLFPTLDSAKFAKQTATEYVGLRSKFEAAVEDPGVIGDAFTAFVDQFTLVGKDGKPLLDAKGQPQLAEDFNLLATHMNKLHAEGSITELEERIAADSYTSDAARERDQQKLLAWKFIMDDEGEADSKPDYSGMSEEARKSAETKDAEIAKLKAALDEKEGKQTASQKQEVRKQWDTDFGREHAKSLVSQTEKIIKEFRDAGSNIPQWMLNLRSPGSDVPVFYMNVLDAFKGTIQADAYTLNQAKAMSRLAPTPENLKERLQFFDQLAKSNLRTIIKDQIRELNKTAAVEPPAKPEEPNPSIEPRASAGPITPQAMTQEQARDMAKSQLAKEIKGWEDMDGSERNPYLLTRISKLMQR